MRKFFVFSALSLVLLGQVSSQPFEITADAMRDIEDTTKSLDSNVALKDAKTAVEQAKEVAAFFQQVEGFYTQKGDAADAVGFACKTHELAAQVQAAVDAQNFDAANEAVSQLARSCKTCHEVYKKKS
jgi:cytochrome c556